MELPFILRCLDIEGVSFIRIASTREWEVMLKKGDRLMRYFYLPDKLIYSSPKDATKIILNNIELYL